MDIIKALFLMLGLSSTVYVVTSIINPTKPEPVSLPEVQKPVDTTYIDVDFSQPSTEKRLTIVKNGVIVYRTWVSHGKNSGQLYATSFSNVPESHKSSLGHMKVGEAYYGKHGLSYRLHGQEKGVNDNVYKRAIVIHSADYIGYGKTGKSLGCLAIPTKDYKDFLKYVKPGMDVRVHL